MDRGMLAGVQTKVNDLSDSIDYGLLTLQRRVAESCFKLGFAMPADLADTASCYL
ncbi:hypothetical protein [Cohnella sp. GCM10012308]|uniref:hypothetical protein n=1 Tax=Cohnella sp. GCM10012308 TaxID=3317329 RepID=UPI00361EF8B6